MLTFLTSANIDLFHEVSDLLFWILGFGLLGLAFVAGGFLSEAFKKWLVRVTDRIHLNLDKSLVDVVLKGIVITVALVISASAMPPIPKVIDAMMPIGDFQEISSEFAAREGKFLINVIFDVLFRQTVLSFAYFIPFIFVDMLVSFLEMFLCAKPGKDSPIRSITSYILDIFTLFAVNAFVLRTGTLFAEIMRGFLDTIDVSLGLFRFLTLGILFLVILFFAMRDLLTSDILVATLGVNIAAALMNITVGDGNRWYMLAIALLCGLGAKLLKRRLRGREHFRTEALSALITVVGTALITALIFTLLPRITH